MTMKNRQYVKLCIEIFKMLLARKEEETDVKFRVLSNKIE